MPVLDSSSSSIIYYEIKKYLHTWMKIKKGVKKLT